MNIFKKSLPIGLLGFALGSSTASGIDLNLASEPLFLSNNVPPNVMFIIDDSGSMQRESMPEELAAFGLLDVPGEDRASFEGLWAHYGYPRVTGNLYGGSDKLPAGPDFNVGNIFSAVYRSSDQNPIYYSPARNYTPWVDADGNSLGDANPWCAPHNPGRNPVSGISCDKSNSTNDVNSKITRSLTGTNSQPGYWWRGESVRCSDYGDYDNSGRRGRNNLNSLEDYFFTEGGGQIFYGPPRLYENGMLLGCRSGVERGHFIRYDVGTKDSTPDDTNVFNLIYYRNGFRRIKPDTDTFFPAYYTTFTDNGRGRYATARLNPSNYVHHYIRPGGLESVDSVGNKKTTSFPRLGDRECGADGNADTCTYAEEIQNFANWYTYYRSRVSLSRKGTGEAFSRLSNNNRVGFGTINDVEGEDVIINKVAPYNSAGRSAFFSTLYGYTNNNAGTPLRRALEAAGKYYSDGSNSGPWADRDDSGNVRINECRQSYTILMSDGFWNREDPENGGNYDGTDGPRISSPSGDNYQYKPEPPYADSYSKTLADVAMYFWNRDLLPSVPNVVRPNEDDPAFWQHMTTFTVGLGVDGSLKHPGDLSRLADGSLDWPRVFGDTATTIDDLWHAAVNGRGQYFSAADAETYAESLSEALASIEKRSGSGGSIGTNTGSTDDGVKLYASRFDPNFWSGDVFSIGIADADSLCGSDVIQEICSTPDWRAADQIALQNWDSGRQIITLDSESGNGVAFRNGTAAPGLTPEQVAYLRGNRSNEGTGPNKFRPRGKSPLGDIVNSGPVFEGAPSRIRYPSVWQNLLNTGAINPEPNNSYAGFRSTYMDRVPMLFVGANDGMLHVLNADTGQELMAYVPKTVIPRLGQLTQPNYRHQLYVDATVASGDVYFGSAWHTVIAGGLGGGGQAVYALDVTGGPGYFNESTSAPDIALWEFTDSDDPDLGNSFGEPTIIRMHNGKWAAVFGNGYNNTRADDPDPNDGVSTVSATGQAAIFIVDIEDGTLLRKIDTGRGSAADPTNQNRANGIAGVSPVDIDGDFITDYLYAGDLFGNMWKIDVTSTSPASWDIGFSSGGTPQPLFTAVDASNKAQPITSKPAIRQHPYGLDHGVIVYFGTGKYLEAADASPKTSPTNSFYGIWDLDVFSYNEPPDFTTPVTKYGYDRSQLQGQEILGESNLGSQIVRVVTDNPSGKRHLDWLEGGVRGFYLDLKLRGQNYAGEMVITQPILTGSLVGFTTLQPVGNSCDSSPNSFFMALDAATGGRAYIPPFDLNVDGEFGNDDVVDLGGEEYFGSGVALDSGGMRAVIRDNTFSIGQFDEKVIQGRINSGVTPGRRAWRELRE